MVTTCTYRPSLVKIDARNFRVIVVTDTARPQTHRQDRLQYTASLASAECNYSRRSIPFRLTFAFAVNTAGRWSLYSLQEDKSFAFLLATQPPAKVGQCSRRKVIWRMEVGLYRNYTAR